MGQGGGMGVTEDTCIEETLIHVINKHDRSSTLGAAIMHINISFRVSL